MFGKNKKRIKELEKEIRLIDERYDRLFIKLRDENAQFRRILEHADKEPTFELRSEICFKSPSRRDPRGFYVYDGNKITVECHDLYMYINHNEYCVRLDELTNLIVDEGSAAFWVEDGLAHFDILTIAVTKIKTRHKFTIDYKRGKYLYSQEPFGEGGNDDDEDV